MNTHDTCKRAGMALRQQGHGCRGFSLVELMVGILISLFLVAAMILMYLSAQRSYTDQDRLAQMQDSQRLALSMLGAIISHAGYVPPSQADDAAAAFTPLSLTASDGRMLSFGAGSFLTGAGKSTDDSSDVVSVRYLSSASEGLMDCTGSGADKTPRLMTSTFSVTTSGQLLCTTGTGTAVELIDGLGRLKVRLGVDMDLDGSVDTYLTPDDVAKAGLWPRVYSVRLALYFIDTTSPTPAQIRLWPNPVVHTIALGNRS